MALRVKVGVLAEVAMRRLGNLIAESEEEGFSYLVRMRNEWSSCQLRFDGPGEACFLAESDGEIVGLCGLTADPHSDDVTVGRVRKLYVSKAYRRQGIATQLLQRLCALAKKHFRELRVKTRGASGYAFYESLGFREVEPGKLYTHCIDLADWQAEISDGRYTA